LSIIITEFNSVSKKIKSESTVQKNFHLKTARASHDLSADSARELIEASKDANIFYLQIKKLGTFRFGIFGGSVTSRGGPNDVLRAGKKPKNQFIRFF